MPKAGWIPTLVPGAPAGWAELSRRFGTKPLPELFAPAIRSAREGVPVAVNLEPMWEEDSQRIGRAMAENPAPHAYWWEKFTKNGEPYRAGDIFRWEEYAQTLEELAATNCESYYRGPLMENCGLQPGDRGLLLRGGLSFLPPHVGGAHLGGLQGVHRL